MWHTSYIYPSNACNYLAITHVKYTKDKVSQDTRCMTLLKADRPHPRNYPPTPNDYRHTDNHLRLVMVVVVLCCTRQSRAHIIDRCAPEFDLDLWPWPVTLSRDLDPTVDLDPWPLTLTRDLDPELWLDLWPWPRPQPLTLTRDLDTDLDLKAM